MAHEFFLPELRFLVEGCDSAFVDTVARILKSGTFERPTGVPPRFTVHFRCSLSERLAASRPVHQRATVRPGIKPASGSPTLTRKLSKDGGTYYVSVGWASARIEHQCRKIIVEIDVQPAHRTGEDGHLGRFIGDVLSVLLYRLGLFPLLGGVARGQIEKPSSTSKNSPEDEQLLLLGPPEPVKATLDALSSDGWTVSDREVFFLKKGEGGVYLLGGNDDLPLALPRTTIFFDFDKDDETRCGRFRNLLFHLVAYSMVPRFVLPRCVLQKHNRILRDLASQVNPVKVRWHPADPASAANTALTRLGAREMRGWDLDSPRFVHAGPVSVPRQRFLYFLSA